MKIGSVVMFTDWCGNVRRKKRLLHSAYPEFYPPAKTIGTVVEIGEDVGNYSDLVKVQWPSGTTSGNDSWWCYSDFLLEL